MLIERQKELGCIEALLAEASEGRGSTLLISGTAGIGKTALLVAARERAAGKGMRVLSAAGGELEHELAFAIVRQLLEPALRSIPEPMRNDVFAGAAGLALPVFEAAHDPAAIGSVVHGLYWVCSNLADAGPLLLAVDDVHWSDEPSLRFLSHLARRVSDLPILLALARRPVPAGHLVERALAGVPLRGLIPRPLSVRGVGQVVREVLSGEPDQTFCEACASASGGNPFLLTEALHSLRADNVRSVAGEARRVARLHPETIVDSVLGRLARLGPQAIRLTRAIAVLGPAADLRRVAALAELPMPVAAELTDRLAGELIVRSGRPIEFVHPLVRAAVYYNSSGFVRAAEHKRAAVLLRAEGVLIDEIAPHLIAAEPESDPWVVETLRATAASALARGAPEVAVACLNRAIAEPPAAGSRRALLAELGRSLGRANLPDEAAEAFRAAIELSDDDSARAGLAMELGALMIQTGRGQESIDAFGLARSALGDDAVEADIRWAAMFAISISSMDSPMRWIPRLDQLVAQADTNADVGRLLLANLAMALAATGQRPAEETARVARLAVAGPLPKDYGWQLANFANVGLAISDHPAEGMQILDRGMDDARRRGNVAEFRHLTVLRSHTSWYAGRMFDAEADGRAAFELSDDGSPQGDLLAASAIIDALVERGKLEEAQLLLERSGIDGELPMQILLSHFALMARGRLRLRQDRPREALQDLIACGEALTAAAITNPGFAHWRAEAALAHLRLGEIEQARALAITELDLARPFGAARAIGVALRVLGLIENELSILEDAVGVLRTSAGELERAYALVDYGAALRRVGRRAQAQEPLREGLDLAARCGAQPLAGRARAELIAAGARPRRSVRSGPAALTGSELRVARLAAEGASNRDIAQALFISRRTVEIHLTNAYRKLGIESRQSLAEALDNS